MSPQPVGCVEVECGEKHAKVRQLCPPGLVSWGQEALHIGFSVSMSTLNPDKWHLEVFFLQCPDPLTPYITG